MLVDKTALSFTSAGAFPGKLLVFADTLLERFPPLHLQINITNDCQLHCSYCSCRDRDRDRRMSEEAFIEAIDQFARAGTRAVTITGGGEPLLHPLFDKYVAHMVSCGLSVGLVTNGIGMKLWPEDVYRDLAWIRVSFDVFRDELPNLYDSVPVAYSYVWTKESAEDANLPKLIRMAETGEIAHLRIVSDICRAEDKAYKFMAQVPSDSPRVIVQNRNLYTPGAPRCWIALIKPVLDVDGQVYPCCGAQYATDDKSRDFPSSLAMGTVDEYLLRYSGPGVPFDGTACKKCYYSMYNTVLEVFRGVPGVEHREFI